MYEGKPRLVAHEEFSGAEDVCVRYITDVLKEIKKFENKLKIKEFDDLIEGKWVNTKDAVKLLNYINDLNYHNNNDVRQDLFVLTMTISNLNKSSNPDYYDLFEECGKNYDKFKIEYVG